MQNFFIGIIFISLIIPFIDCIVSIFQQFSTYICTLITLKTYKLQKPLPEQQEEGEKENTYVIGFQAPPANNEEEEWEDE